MDRQEEKEIQKKLEEFEKELFEGDLFDENPSGSAADQTPPEDDALDETDTSNSKELMTALKDILATNEAGVGYFSTIFANALIANEEK